ncbi:MAG TPA: alpha-ketoacid dehydrogenase subunit beta [Bacillota bacterium]|nr:alpha-ketoacid dehydrogenase subunit beta [Bacillota bacterium]
MAVNASAATATKPKSNLEAVREAMREEMARDPRVILMGEDVGVRGGVFQASAGLFDQFGGKRVIDTPLAESVIVGAAIGAAVAGLRPIAEIQFADFIAPAMDQIINEAARIRYRSYNGWSCPMVIRAPFGGGVHGGLYHSQSVEAIFAHVPGLKVVAPSTPADMKGLLKAAIRDDDPVIFFEHKAIYGGPREIIPEGDHVVPIGKAAVKRPGEHVTVIAYGMMLHRALQAAEQLAAEGVSVEVLDLRTLRPLDHDAILATARKTGRVCIVYEDNKALGVGAEVAAMIAEEALFDLDAPIVRVAGPEVPGMPYAAALEEWFMPSVEGIAEALRKLAAF